MGQPPESPTFQEGNMVRAKEKGLLMSNVNTEPVLRKAVGVHAVRPFLPCTLPLFEAGSRLVVRFLGKALGMWWQSRKFILVNYQSEVSRGVAVTAHHSDREMFHLLNCVRLAEN